MWPGIKTGPAQGLVIVTRAVRKSRIHDRRDYRDFRCVS